MIDGSEKLFHPISPPSFPRYITTPAYPPKAVLGVNQGQTLVKSGKRPRKRKKIKNISRRAGVDNDIHSQIFVSATHKMNTIII